MGGPCAVRSHSHVVGLIAVLALPAANLRSEDAAAQLAGSIDPVAEAEPETARSESLLERWHIYAEPGRDSFVALIHDRETGSG